MSDRCDCYKSFYSIRYTYRLTALKLVLYVSFRACITIKKKSLFNDFILSILPCTKVPYTGVISILSLLL